MDEDVIIVNGISYREKEKPKSKVGKRLARLEITAMMFGGFAPNKEPELPKVDIVKEFELIQNKKSQLSKSQRDLVEYKFHLNFTKV